MKHFAITCGVVWAVLWASFQIPSLGQEVLGLQHELKLKIAAIEAAAKSKSRRRDEAADSNHAKTAAPVSEKLKMQKEAAAVKPSTSATFESSASSDHRSKPNDKISIVESSMKSTQQSSEKRGIKLTGLKSTKSDTQNNLGEIRVESPKKSADKTKPSVTSTTSGSAKGPHADVKESSIPPFSSSKKVDGVRSSRSSSSRSGAGTSSTDEIDAATNTLETEVKKATTVTQHTTERTGAAATSAESKQASAASVSNSPKSATFTAAARDSFASTSSEVVATAQPDSKSGNQQQAQQQQQSKGEWLSRAVRRGRSFWENDLAAAKTRLGAAIRGKQQPDAAATATGDQQIPTSARADGSAAGSAGAADVVPLIPLTGSSRRRLEESASAPTTASGGTIPSAGAGGTVEAAAPISAEDVRARHMERRQSARDELRGHMDRRREDLLRNARLSQSQSESETEPLDSESTSLPARHQQQGVQVDAGLEGDRVERLLQRTRRSRDGRHNPRDPRDRVRNNGDGDGRSHLREKERNRGPLGDDGLDPRVRHHLDQTSTRTSILLDRLERYNDRFSAEERQEVERIVAEYEALEAAVAQSRQRTAEDFHASREIEDREERRAYLDRLRSERTARAGEEKAARDAARDKYKEAKTLIDSKANNHQSELR